jgi:hypothetical protein
MKKSRGSAIGPLTQASLIFGFVTTILGFYFFQLGPIVLVCSLTLSALVALMEHLIARFEALEETLAGRIADRNVEVLRARVKNKYVESMFDAVAKQRYLDLEQLTQPKHEFRTEAEFFNAVSDELRSAKTGDRFKVICTECASGWESRFVRRYVAATQVQANHGVKTFLLKEGLTDGLPDLCRLPENMGLGVVNEERVYLHWRSENDWYGCVFNSKGVASVVLSTFATLEAQADEIKPDSGKPPQAA